MSARCFSCLEMLEDRQLHQKCYARLFGSRKVQFQLDYLRSEVIEAVRTRAARMSLGGAQPKAGLRINNGRLEIVSTGATHLLKPTTERHPFISENEHLCMNIAARCGLPVPPFCLIPLKNGELAFLIKRFDRAKNEKIHIEDFASVLKLPADAKYDGSYLEVGRGIEQWVRDTGIEKQLFLRLVMISYLIGNNDLHLKNFSLLDCGNHYSLTPVYDVVCAARYYDQHDLALSLAPGFLGHLETNGYYTAEDFIELALRLEIQQKPAEKIVAALIKMRTPILDLVAASFLPETEKEAISNIIQEQYRKFES